jgi:FKBP-type peptidyl-prolyl cis-trans isomerase 2
LTIFSRCTGQKTLKKGDNISIEYKTSLEEGKVLDNSNEVAKENNLSSPGREFKPLQF